MLAKIKENVFELCCDYFDDESIILVDSCFKTANDLDFKELCERIAGKVVNLTFTHGDAFEEIDNNYWLPDFCWEPVEEQTNEN